MSGDNKTEKPTARRMEKAREQGQVAKSMDLNGAMVLATALMVFSSGGEYTMETLRGIMQELLSYVPHKEFTITTFSNLWQEGLVVMLLLLTPFTTSLLVAGVGMNLAQVRPLFTLQPLQPKLDKINPINGFKRMFSMRAAMESVKAMIKMTVIGWVTYGVIDSHQGEMANFHLMALPEVTHFIWSIMGHISMSVVMVMFIIGAADWWYQRYNLEKQLRMTKQEIRDEHKDMEGDPKIKQRIRQMGQQMARKRQLADVPTADVIITNPTHFAIAIKYDPDVYPAPHVVAKGVDHFALKIREVAKANGVPTIENRPLARSLYAMVDVYQMIPPDFFTAVAEVLAYVYSKNKGRKLSKTLRASRAR